MKNLFLILLLTFGIWTAGSSCSEAYQLRYFPIGIADSSIILIETSLNRYDAIAENQGHAIRWKGTLTLKQLDEKGTLSTVKIIDTVDFQDIEYVNGLKIPFEAAILKAKQLTNFIVADNQILEFCNFKTDCKIANLKTEKNNKKMTLFSYGKGAEIIIPKKILEESEKNGGIASQIFKINSIRKLTIGKITLLVVNCAAGEEHNSMQDVYQAKKEQCSSPTECIYPEVVIYHGVSFDTVIWN